MSAEIEALPNLGPKSARWLAEIGVETEAQLRAAGAVILGKTVTCEFAGLTPNVTRNPHNLAHTPGGSSSGSGAAVADHMVAVAFGTQTGGSVLRPASFCGDVGYKPTYNLICRGGIKFAAESRDTIGLLARDLDDVDLVASVLTMRGLAPKRTAAPRIGPNRVPTPPMIGPRMISMERLMWKICSGKRLL